MGSLPRFYVYVLARPNRKPFYVGKGKGRRVYNHEGEARSGHKCHKCNVIRKIWRQGGEVQRYIVFVTDNEQEALDYEVEMIALYGRRTLCNLTDGGDNPSITEEMLAKMRATNQKKSPEEKAETRRKQSIAKKGIKMREDVRLRQLGRKMPPRTEGYKRNLSERQIGLKKSAQQCENQSRAHRRDKIYTMIAPDGTVHEDIASVAGFQKEHGLPNGTIQNMLRGHRNTAGWQIVVSYAA